MNPTLPSPVEPMPGPASYATRRKPRRRRRQRSLLSSMRGSNGPSVTPSVSSATRRGIRRGSWRDPVGSRWGVPNQWGYPIAGCFFYGKIHLWMIWGYLNFRKPSYWPYLKYVVVKEKDEKRIQDVWVPNLAQTHSHIWWSKGWRDLSLGQWANIWFKNLLL